MARLTLKWPGRQRAWHLKRGPHTGLGKWKNLQDSAKCKCSSEMLTLGLGEGMQAMLLALPGFSLGWYRILGWIFYGNTHCGVLHGSYRLCDVFQAMCWKVPSIEP